MARVKWNERPRAQRWAIVGAFVGMAVAAVVAFEYAFHGTTLQRYLIMMSGLLIGGGVGLWVATFTGRRIDRP